MQTQTGATYALSIGPLDAGRLFVTAMRGTEILGRDYGFTLDLRYREDVIDLRDFVDQVATLTIELTGTEHADAFTTAKRVVHGVISDATLHGKDGEDFSLQVNLAPRLSLLRRSCRSRIFMLSAKQTVPDVIEQILKDQLFEPGTDFDLGKLDRSRYPVRDYLVQYEESDFDFIQRWMEHEGIFLVFDHSGQREQAVFCDSKDHYRAMDWDGGGTLPFRPGGGGGATAGSAVLFSLGMTLTTIPTHVAMQDYNWRANTWRDPAGSLLLTTPTSAGRGAPQAPEREPRLHHEFDTYYDTRQEGDWLIKRRCEGLDARELRMLGNSSCPALAPGVRFKPEDSDLNGIPEVDYCVVSISHGGEIAVDDIGETRTGSYGNAFKAIPADRSYRPERSTPWPQIYGVMHAVVDGERCDENASDDSDDDAYAYAEISPNGEYRVRMPFDLAAHSPGEPASCWIRMAQPNSGKDYGMHFPLHVGSEVLISHIDGNPDRPVIIGTVPSAHTASPVNQHNSHQNIMRTSSGHQLVMDDMYGSQRIVIENAKSTVFEMYGRDFTAANEFAANPASLLSAGTGPRPYVPAATASGPYRPGHSASHNADPAAGFFALGDPAPAAEATSEPTEPTNPTGFGAAISAAPAGAAANVSLGRGGGETAEEQIQNYVGRSFPSERFWDHFRRTNTVPHLELGNNIALYVEKDFRELFRVVDREKYLLPAGSLDQDNHEQCKDAGETQNRREVIDQPREKLEYLAPASLEQGDPNLQCYKYSGSIGWQWINCGPEVGLQYGRVHKRTEGDVTTFHRGDRFHSHEQGDVYEFLHNQNHYVYRSGNDYRVGGGYEHRNTINQDLVEETFINQHDRQEVSFSFRLTAASTAHTELVATATHQQGLSATTSTRFRDITDRDLEIVQAKTVQRMIDAKRETRISGDDLIHVGANRQEIVKGTHLTNAANHQIEVPGTQSVKSAASTFLFKDGFTIKQDAAGAAPQPQAPAGLLASAADQRLKQAETMVDDAYEQGQQTTQHTAPAKGRQQDAPQPESASGGGNGIAMEAKQLIGTSTTGKIAWDAKSNFEVKAASAIKLTAKGQVQISGGSSKVEIKGGSIHIG